MIVLVINAGSSSLKYQVIDMDTESMLGKGLVERIGTEGSKLTQTSGKGEIVVCGKLKNHTEAFMLVMEALTDKEKGIIGSVSEIGAIGHRVLHSGEDFSSSVLIDDEVMKICRKNEVLGPLHMPANLNCIDSCRKLMPGVPNVAVFDTVFHSTMPDYAYMYAIDYEDYKKYKVRKYGFHGTSHKYVSQEAIKFLGQDKSKVITCHLGNGSSLAAVVDGKCVDTSMGLTPLEGMVMGTRSGDIDAAVVGFLAEQKNISAADVVSYLNKCCGFLGLAGVTDFRDITARCEAGDERAQLAANLFAYRIKKYIGGYFAAMGGLDCVVFTGGIGENAAYARKLIMQGLEHLGIDFDFDFNEKAPRGKFSVLTKPESKVKVVVIPTNEELMIARESKEIVESCK
ncbi:MAG: acetate kinase [Clostridiales bacterium]|jgi:acetate kinase|nr:acetate kinase [Clostridiales bacterium]